MLVTPRIEGLRVSTNLDNLVEPSLRHVEAAVQVGMCYGAKTPRIRRRILRVFGGVMIELTGDNAALVRSHQS